jgi:hypothetical protein
MLASMNKQFGALEGPKKARASSAVAVAVVLLATLWPVNPFPMALPGFQERMDLSSKRLVWLQAKKH